MVSHTQNQSSNQTSQVNQTSQDKYLKIVLYIAGISYALAFMTYADKFMHGISDGNGVNILANFMLIVSFGLLSYICFVHAQEKDKNSVKSAEFNITSTPGRYGYMILSLYFMLALLLPFGIRFNYYYIFALLGYTLIAFKEISGIYLLTLFYIISIGVTFYYYKENGKKLDYFVLLSKIGLILYFGTYGYMYIMQNKK